MPDSSRRAFLQRALTIAGAAAIAPLAVACRGDDGDKRAASSASTSTSTRPSAPTTAEATADRALDAFYAGFPLVTTVRTLQTFGGLVGVNRAFATGGLTNPTSHFIVAPNRDTVYVLAVLDLRAGPQLVTLPAITDRYNVFQFIDAWMGTFALLGTRPTHGRAGTWAVTPPNYRGALPRGAHELASPTNQALMLGRIRAIDDADARVASGIGRQVRLEPATGAPASATVPPIGAAPGSPAATGSNGVAYFDELGDALGPNPPVTARQQSAIAAVSTLGVGAGRHPSTNATPAARVELQRATLDGLRGLTTANANEVHTTNGWQVNLDLGTDASNLTLRQQAGIARYAWGPVPAVEAVYPRLVSASDGRPADGSKRYRIHFARGATPPVDAFWSYTVYGPDMYLVPNPQGRYSISGDTPGLMKNADGSLDIYLQRDAPAGHEANWLPVPSGPFNVIMRCYLPRAPILHGRYEYPALRVMS